MNPLLQEFSSITNMPTWLLAIILTWTLAWKGIALWKASQRKSSTWFVLILVVNTIGILEILYYYLFSEMKLSDKKDNKNQEKTKIGKKANKTPVRKNLAKQKAFLDN